MGHPLASQVLRLFPPTHLAPELNACEKHPLDTDFPGEFLQRRLEGEGNLSPDLPSGDVMGRLGGDRHPQS